MKKIPEHKITDDLKITHTPICDLVEESQRNSRRFLFAKAFAPHLVFNFIQPLEFVFWDVKESYEMGIHTHKNGVEFIIALEGQYTCSVNGQQIILNPREGILIQRGDTHRDDCTTPCRFLVLGFETVDFLGQPYQGMHLKQQKKLQDRRFSYLKESEIDYLIAQAANQSETDRLFIRQASYSFAQVLIWRFLDLIRLQISEEFMELLFNNLFQKRLNSLFFENISGMLSVDQMAKKMNMSRKSLELKCIKILGKSPAKAFLSMKMEYAAKLLSSNRSSKDITKILGFNNQFHFSRAFKNYYGMTASEFYAKR